MKNAVLIALLSSSLTSPALAHSGAHMHPHSIEFGIIGLAALLVIAAVAFAMKARK